MKFVSKEKISDDRLIEYLSKTYNIHPVVADILIDRGVADELDDFFGDGIIHDPFLLNDMQKSVECIQKYINDGERITVYGDYDVDGVCSCSILYLYLKSVGADVDVFIPDRHDDGYGLNTACLERIAKIGTKLLITVDCGITNVQEVEFAKSLGMDVIITDHHQCPQVLPDCIGVVNPLLGNYPFRLLCGSGVALKLVLALDGQDEFDKYVDIAAIATVADLVPLIGENRSIVKRGLQKINSPKRRSAISALCAKSGINDEITAGNIAFGLGPRINAAGRMSKAKEAFELMVCDDYKKSISIADILNKYNSIRKQEETDIYDKAVEAIENSGLAKSNRIITVCGKGWNKGVIGIVASKLVERYSRPVIVFSEEDNICVGSGRSVPGVHLFNLINNFGNDFIKFGGHEMAAGMTIEAQKLSLVSKKLNEFALKHFSDELFVPTAYYDAEIFIEDINYKLAMDIHMLSPMGMGNKTPVFKLSNVEVAGARLIGNEQNHIKMSIVKNGKSVDAVAFSMGSRIEELQSGGCFDILFNVEINSWENRDYVQLQIKEFKANINSIKDSLVFGNGKKYFNSLLSSAMLPIEKVDHKRIRQMWNWEKYIDQRLKKDVISTAIYTSVPICSYELINYLSKNNLDGNVSFCIGQPENNSCVVFAPDWNHDELDYSRLVIFDYAPTEFVNRILAKNKHIKIVLCHNDFSYNCLEKFAMGIDFERESAAKYYSILKSICSKETDALEVVNKFCILGQETQLNAFFAINVFEELGLLEMHNNKVSMSVAEEKKDLSSSKIIENMYRLKEKIFDELDLIIPPREYKGKSK